MTPFSDARGEGARGPGQGGSPTTLGELGACIWMVAWSARGFDLDRSPSTPSLLGDLGHFTSHL